MLGGKKAKRGAKVRLQNVDDFPSLVPSSTNVHVNSGHCGENRDDDEDGGANREEKEGEGSVNREGEEGREEGRKVGEVDGGVLEVSSNEEVALGGGMSSLGGGFVSMEGGHVVAAGHLDCGGGGAVSKGPNPNATPHDFSNLVNASHNQRGMVMESQSCDYSSPCLDPIQNSKIQKEGEKGVGMGLMRIGPLDEESNSIGPGVASVGLRDDNGPVSTSFGS